MVRSAVWVPTASTGRVPWMAPAHGACTSAAALPTLAATTVRAVTLCVALRNDTFDLPAKKIVQAGLFDT